MDLIMSINFVVTLFNVIVFPKETVSWIWGKTFKINQGF